MIGKLVIKLALFGIATYISLSSTGYLENPNKPTVAGVSHSQSNQIPKYSSVFAALPSKKSDMVTSVKTADARAEILRQYLQKYSSELEPYADLIVHQADINNFDYRWMVAIAMQESTLCRFIPENSYNCWGWGIYGDKVTRFDSYEDAITSIAPQFKRIFLQDKHLKDPYEVMKTYTPPSDGSWAEGVLLFFKQLE